VSSSTTSSFRQLARRVPWLHELLLRARRAFGRLQTGATFKEASILQDYVKSPPSPQNALDIFKGQWWSALPDDLGVLSAGATPLFADDRIKWLLDELGGVSGKKILELGPLEAGHTYMLERAGASSIVAVEANTRAYLKCLIVKELFKLPHARFICGDFEEYLRSTDDYFDLCVASGVLYHLRNPVELIYRTSQVADTMFMWTHFYSEAEVNRIPHIGPKMKGHLRGEFRGFAHTLHKYSYEDFLDTNRFAGGTERYSCWLSKEDLIAAVKFFGFSHIRFGREERDHVNGPCIEFIASKRAE
jgi:hypothetical protein